MAVSRVVALTACAGFCLSAMNVAQASFVLTLTSGADSVVVSDDQLSGVLTDSGLTTTAADGNITDPGLITYNASIGSFTVSVTTGVSDPVIGPGRLDLNSIEVSGGAGTLDIGLTDTGYSGSASQYSMGFGGTTDGTLGFTFLYGTANQEFVGDVMSTVSGITGAGQTGAFGSETSAAVNTSDPYSLTILATIEHTGANQITSFDAIATPVPVPAAVWLFGSGLLGLVGVARRRRA